MKLTFVEAHEFSRARGEHLEDDTEFFNVQDFLLDNPRKGEVIPGAGGIRKLRWEDAKRGKGKRGGLRIIYLYVEEAANVLFLTVYDKNTPDLTSDQKKAFAKAVAVYREDLKKPGGKAQ